MRKPGKKIGTFEVRVGPQAVEVDLRCNLDTGVFYAEHAGEMFEDHDLAALKKTLAARVVGASEVTWQRFIVVEYEAHVGPKFRDGDRNNYGGSLDERALRPEEELTKLITDGDFDPKYSGDPREADVVRGVELSWFIVDYSSKISGGTRGTVRLTRNVDEQTMQASERVEQERDAEIPHNAIEFTPDRLRFLCEMRDAFRRLDYQLVQLFRGARSEVAERFDLGLELLAMSHLKALPAPPDVEIPTKKARRK